MTNFKTVRTIIAVLLFLFGLVNAYFSFVTYLQTMGIDNVVVIPGAYLLSAIGGVLIMLSAFVLSPLYDSFFKKNKTILMFQYVFLFILLLIGFLLILFLTKDVSVPAIGPIN